MKSCRSMDCANPSWGGRELSELPSYMKSLGKTVVKGDIDLLSC